MKILTLLMIAMVAVLALVLYYITENRILENDLYRCEQDWAKEYAELRTQNKILDFKYESLKFECNK